MDNNVELAVLEMHETSAMEDISVGVMAPEDLERYAQAWDQGVEKQKTERKNQILQGDDNLPEPLETDRTNIPNTARTLITCENELCSQLFRPFAAILLRLLGHISLLEPGPVTLQNTQLLRLQHPEHSNFQSHRIPARSYLNRPRWD